MASSQSSLAGAPQPLGWTAQPSNSFHLNNSVGAGFTRQIYGPPNHETTESGQENRYAVLVELQRNLAGDVSSVFASLEMADEHPGLLLSLQHLSAGFKKLIGEFDEELRRLACLESPPSPPSESVDGPECGSQLETEGDLEKSNEKPASASPTGETSLKSSTELSRLDTRDEPMQSRTSSADSSPLSPHNEALVERVKKKTKLQPSFIAPPKSEARNMVTQDTEVVSSGPSPELSDGSNFPSIPPTTTKRKPAAKKGTRKKVSPPGDPGSERDTIEVRDRSRKEAPVKKPTVKHKPGKAPVEKAPKSAPEKTSSLAVRPRKHNKDATREATAKLRKEATKKKSNDTDEVHRTFASDIADQSSDSSDNEDFNPSARTQSRKPPPKSRNQQPDPLVTRGRRKSPSPIRQPPLRAPTRPAVNTPSYNVPAYMNLPDFKKKKPVVPVDTAPFTAPDITRDKEKSSTRAQAAVKPGEQIANTQNDKSRAAEEIAAALREDQYEFFNRRGLRDEMLPSPEHEEFQTHIHAAGRGSLPNERPWNYVPMDSNEQTLARRDEHSPPPVHEQPEKKRQRQAQSRSPPRRPRSRERGPKPLPTTYMAATTARASAWDRGGATNRPSPEAHSPTHLPTYVIEHMCIRCGSNDHYFYTCPEMKKNGNR